MCVCVFTPDVMYVCSTCVHTVCVSVDTLCVTLTVPDSLVSFRGMGALAPP